jgi:hypothetical protein
MGFVQRCRSKELIPTLEKINTRGTQEDSFKIAYYMYVKEIREQLSVLFKSLSKVLQERIEIVLSSVADVLGQQGYLQDLTPQKGSKFFNEILKQISSDTSLPKLKQGFADMQRLEDTDYEDIINDWIRLHLEKLRPDDNTDPISLSIYQFQTLKPYESKIAPSEESEENSEFSLNSTFITNFLLKLLGIPIPEIVIASIVEFFKHSKSYNNDDPEFIANAKEHIASQLDQLDIEVDVEIIKSIMNYFAVEFSQKEKKENQVVISNSSLPLNFSKYEQLIEHALVSLRDQVVDECEKTLNNHLNEPNKLAYTIVRKFVDSVIAAPYVQTQWRIYLRRKEAIVWPKSKEKEEAIQIEQQLKELVNKAIEINKSTVPL